MVAFALGVKDVSLESLLHERHQIDELRVGAGARLRAFQHDRAERTGGDDGVGAGVLQLLEAHVADARTRLFFFVREQQAAAGAAAERVVTIAHRLLDVGAESLEQLARLLDMTGVSSQVARVVERDRRRRSRLTS